MELSPGTKLGPYEILAPLGAGGMGEVYRARDTKLGREVAVKVLTQHLSGDPDSLARFEREAKAAAALNHPGILSIFDFGRSDATVYAVMELLEGESLRARLAGGPLPVRKAGEWAVQIARALAAAHEKGIVHRDLKPENLFIGRDGRTKILDFGLAKHVGASSDHDTRSPTVAQTDPGTVLGTVGYMSPEQVRGQPADARSDLFSLGAVLYEMLTGRRAFAADSPVETMNAILREEAPDISGIRPAVPPALDRIVRRCLEKRPDDRFRSAHDLAFALETLSGADSSPAIGLSTGAHGITRERIFRRLTYRRGTISSARFAPDGHSVVYGADWSGGGFELFTSRADSPESRPLGLPPADVLAMSSNGEMALSIGHRFRLHFKAAGTLSRASLAGGAVRKLLPEVQQADWAPDGKSLAIVRDVEGRCRLEFPFGQVLYETTGWISRPRVSIDGRLVAFLDHPRPGDDGGEVAMVDRSGRKTTLTRWLPSVTGLAWSAGGEEVWFSAIKAGASYGVFGVDLSGRERIVLPSPGRLKLHDVAHGGRVLVSTESYRQGINARIGEESHERELSWFDGSMATHLSPDGKTLLFSEVGEAGIPSCSVFLRETDGAPAVRLGDGISTQLSPDGMLALAILKDPHVDLVAYPTGLGEQRSLKADAIQAYEWAAWHPDGQRVLFVGSESGQGKRLYVQPLRGGPPRAVSDHGVATRFSEPIPVSPDGAWVVLQMSDGRFWRLPLEGGAASPIEGLQPGEIPIGFEAEGGGLFFVSEADLPARIHRLSLESGDRALWRELVPPDPTGIVTTLPVLITPDGSSYAYSYMRLTGDLYLLDGLD